MSLDGATGFLGCLPLNCGNLSPVMDLGKGASTSLCLLLKRLLPDLSGPTGHSEHPGDPVPLVPF